MCRRGTASGQGRLRRRWRHGRGIASCRTADGWSAPAFISVGGGSWGPADWRRRRRPGHGVMNDRGLQHLLSSKFQIGGDASASAGPVGRHASAGTGLDDETELLTYSRSHGIFAGITLDGAVVEQDADSTPRHLWRRSVVPGHPVGQHTCAKVDARLWSRRWSRPARAGTVAERPGPAVIGTQRRSGRFGGPIRRARQQGEIYAAYERCPHAVIVGVLCGGEPASSPCSQQLKGF